MRKWILALALLMLCLPAAQAAEWGEGLSAAQPYGGVPEVKLDQSMGYILRYPRAELPAQNFCDTLELYLPRDDVRPESGALRLLEGKDTVCEVNFDDADSVEVRPLEEPELEGLVWGGGVCVEIHLPVSLAFDKSYHVEMDEGCFSAAGGKVLSVPITAEDAWQPVLAGDYGVGSLRYGDENRLAFDLRLGGEAAGAVLYSGDNSVEFEKPEYAASGEVTGEITGDSANWGVVFLNAGGEAIDSLEFVK